MTEPAYKGHSVKQWAPLVNIEVVSGTAQDGPAEFRGAVTVRAIAEDGSIMAGQLDPDEVRQMALSFLSVAEAADQDALIFRVMTKNIGAPAEVVAGLVMDMRKERGRSTPGADNGTSVKPGEREEWAALAMEQRLDLLPVEALVASIHHLARRLLDLSTAEEDPRPHYAVQVTNMPPTEIVCKCGERFVGGDVLAKMRDHMVEGNP